MGDLGRAGVIAAVAAAALGLAPSAPLAGQTPAVPKVEVRIGGRAQIQYSTTSIDEEDVPGFADASSTFEARRLRLRADITVGDWIDARIQPDFAMGRLRMADAYINFAFHPPLQLRVGQFKKAYSLLENVSSTLYPTIERGVRLRGLDALIEAGAVGATGAPAPVFAGDVLIPEEQYLLGSMGYLGRDLGAALHGAAGRFGWEVGVFNGNGADQPDRNGAKSVSARLAVTPVEAWPLTIGVAAARQDVLTDAGPTRTGTGWEVDLEYGAFQEPGLHVLAEAVLADNLAVEDDELVGVQAIGAWYVPLSTPRFEGLELVGRVGWADVQRDIDGDEGTLLTPGVNLYLFGRNRLMLNWDVFVPSGDGIETAHGLRAQAQVYW